MQDVNNTFSLYVTLTVNMANKTGLETNASPFTIHPYGFCQCAFGGDCFQYENIIVFIEITNAETFIFSLQILFYLLIKFIYHF